MTKQIIDAFAKEQGRRWLYVHPTSPESILSQKCAAQILADNASAWAIQSACQWEYTLSVTPAEKKNQNLWP